LNWRINAALESFRKKYSVSKHTMVAVFVDKSLESVLRDVGAHSGVFTNSFAVRQCRQL
ncbi:hypothetical protein T4B_10705, partial [Trichinella pseudospiralis]